VGNRLWSCGAALGACTTRRGQGDLLQPAGARGARPARGAVAAHGDAGPLPHMHSVWTTVWTTSPSR